LNHPNSGLHVAGRGGINLAMMNGVGLPENLEVDRNENIIR